jgi:hypothetical protein
MLLTMIAKVVVTAVMRGIHGDAESQPRCKPAISNTHIKFKYDIGDGRGGLAETSPMDPRWSRTRDLLQERSTLSLSQIQIHRLFTLERFSGFLHSENYFFVL